MHRWLQTTDHFFQGGNVRDPEKALPFEDSSKTPGNLTSRLPEEEQVRRKVFHMEEHKEEGSLELHYPQIFSLELLNLLRTLRTGNNRYNEKLEPVA